MKLKKLKKIILANECTKMIHGDKEAKLAEQTAKKTFNERSTGVGLPVIKIKQKTAYFKLEVLINGEILSMVLSL